MGEGPRPRLKTLATCDEGHSARITTFVNPCASGPGPRSWQGLPIHDGTHEGIDIMAVRPAHITAEKGDITIQFFPDEAQDTMVNFETYAFAGHGWTYGHSRDAHLT